MEHEDEQEQQRTYGYGHHVAEVVHGHHLAHAAEAAHHAMAHHASSPTTTSGPAPTAPGSGGPHDPEWWIEPATSSDIEDMLGVVTPEADAEAAAAARIPTRAPVSGDMADMIENMRAQGVDIPDAGTRPSTAARDELRALREEHRVAIGHEALAEEAAAPERPSASRARLERMMDEDMTARAARRGPAPSPGDAPALGSEGRPFDPMEIRAPGADPNYPPHDGAVDGVIERGVVPAAETASRIGTESEHFMAVGDPTLDERALPQQYTADGAVDEFPRELRSYSVTRDIPAELSDAAPAFGRSGGARQFRPGVSARVLREAGYLQLDYEHRPATPEECAEIDSAVAEEEAASRALAPTGASETAAPVDATPAPVDATPAPTVDAAAPTTPGPTDPVPSTSLVGAGMGILGTYGATQQLLGVGDDVQRGQYTLAGADLVSALGNGATSIAGTGVLSQAATDVLASPPALLAAGLVGSVAAGERVNEAEGTFGDDHESSLEFVADAATSSGAGVYDAIAGDSDNPLVQAAGGTAAVVGGGAAGTAAALVALGGDLYNGVPEVVSSAYDTLTRPGEEFVEGTDTYGAPTRDAQGHVHHVTAGEFVTRTTGDAYTTVHDAVAGLAGPDHQHDAIGTVADGAGAVFGAGAGIVGGAAAATIGLGGSIVGACGHLGEAADRVWSHWFQ